MGPVRWLLVPVAHQGEHVGGYITVVKRGEPHFADIPKFWERSAAGPRRVVAGAHVEQLEVLADSFLGIARQTPLTHSLPVPGARSFAGTGGANAMLSDYFCARRFGVRRRLGIDPDG